MSILQNMNLGLRFLLEVCGLVAIGYWGFYMGNGMMLKMILGIGSPLFIAFIWGVFGSPNAVVKISMPYHLVFEIIIFVLPFIALFVTGNVKLAWIYGIIVVINRLFMFWDQ